MKLPTPFLVLTVAAALAGCADPPTMPARVQEAGPRFTDSWSVTISGPDAVDRSGSYTYYASTYALVSPTFKWSVRTCPTTDVGSCTSSWTIWPWTSANYFTTYLSVDCFHDAPRAFQISVVAKGWASPEVSDTHVTVLCPELA